MNTAGSCFAEVYYRGSNPPTAKKERRFMKCIAASFIAALLMTGTACTSQQEQRMEQNMENKTGEHKMTAAEKRGTERALADIKNGNMKILIFGERNPDDNRRQYDEETGLPLVNEEWDDLPSNDYPEEVRAYNRTIREYMKQHGKKKKHEP